MMVQNEHWNGQPRPRSKLDLRPSLRASAAGGRLRRRRALDARQIVHVVVERLQRAVPGIEQDGVEPAFLGLAGEDRDAHVHGRLDLGRHDRQHRQAAGGMEAAHRHRQAGLEELAGKIDGARELVGLHADQADQRLAAAALDVGHDAVGRTRVLVSSNGLIWMSTSGPRRRGGGNPHPGHRARPGYWTGCGSAAK